MVFRNTGFNWFINSLIYFFKDLIYFSCVPGFSNFVFPVLVFRPSGCSGIPTFNVLVQAVESRISEWMATVLFPNTFIFSSVETFALQSKQTSEVKNFLRCFDGLIANYEQIMILKLLPAPAASRVYVSIIFYRWILIVKNKTKVLTSRKSISDSSSQTLLSAEPVRVGNTSAFAAYFCNRARLNFGSFCVAWHENCDPRRLSRWSKDEFIALVFANLNSACTRKSVYFNVSDL